MARSRAKRDGAWGATLTYSRKVFIPLTQLCRDVCHYCTFAKAPRALKAAYLSPDEALAIASAGRAAGCKEALFTLGDKPELRYAAARRALEGLGFETTLDYLAHVARLVLRETGLLPHPNPGVMSAAEIAKLRPVAASMGLMLETSAARLSSRGGPHFGSPDKAPAIRLRTLDDAGRLRTPMTTGLLIGIGETRAERLDALLAIRDLHRTHGHIQEVIIQNFRAKAGTRMAHAREPDEAELLWTIAAARLILDEEISVQAPPNLNPGRIAALIGAGINDWGGLSPVTIDHVNPECAWPDIARLEDACAAEGFALVERLAVYPRYLDGAWIDETVRPAVLALADGEGRAREESWRPGEAAPAPGAMAAPLPAGRCGHVRLAALDAAAAGRAGESEIAALFAARGDAARAIIAYADELRRAVCGDAVTYVVNRNINYTNICTYHCSFCAFSKTSAKAGLRDAPYRLSAEEIARRVQEAAAAGATEVCLQGGIHPAYHGDTYREICRAAKTAHPAIHIHAFSPLEITHGATTLGLPVTDFLRLLQADGLASLPGTAAEILCDDVRARLCPDKLSTREWLAVIRAAHGVGLPTTATIMFGHLDRYDHWAQHLLIVRRLQEETGGFTEFVPLPFVSMQAPIFVRGAARAGPTWRECVLMHAIARIALHGAIGNIQASWVKLGVGGASACLAAGANDIGGVLMNESISRAAGAAHGQSLDVAALSASLAHAARPLTQRTTLYGRLRGAPGCEDLSALRAMRGREVQSSGRPT
jgi:FO synthase